MILAVPKIMEKQDVNLSGSRFICVNLYMWQI